MAMEDRLTLTDPVRSVGSKSSRSHSENILCCSHNSANGYSSDVNDGGDVVNGGDRVVNGGDENDSSADINNNVDD